MKTHTWKWRTCYVQVGLLLILSACATSTACAQVSEEKEVIERLIDRSIELDYLKSGYEQLKKETEYVRLENQQLREKVQFQEMHQRLRDESAAKTVSTQKKAAFWRGFRWGAGTIIILYTVAITL